jgi:superfamily II DNA or RNA helicase
MPEVGCCILARPTRKMGLYRQMIGRVLRPAAGKPDAIVPFSDTVLSRIESSGRLIRIDTQKVPNINSAAQNTARGCWNARSAARSAWPANHVRTADFFHSDRHAQLILPTAILVSWMPAAASMAKSTTMQSELAGTRC